MKLLTDRHVVFFVTGKHAFFIWCWSFYFQTWVLDRVKVQSRVHSGTLHLNLMG